MGRFKTFMTEASDDWSDQPLLVYLHDEMGTDFLKLLLQYEQHGWNDMDDELKDEAVDAVRNKLLSDDVPGDAGELWDLSQKQLKRELRKYHG